jgi:hypothetical protein
VSFNQFLLVGSTHLDKSASVIGEISMRFNVQSSRNLTPVEMLNSSSWTVALEGNRRARPVG